MKNRNRAAALAITAALAGTLFLAAPADAATPQTGSSVRWIPANPDYIKPKQPTRYVPTNPNHIKPKVDTRQHHGPWAIAESKKARRT